MATVAAPLLRQWHAVYCLTSFNLCRLTVHLVFCTSRARRVHPPRLPPALSTRQHIRAHAHFAAALLLPKGMRSGQMAPLTPVWDICQTAMAADRGALSMVRHVAWWCLMHGAQCVVHGMS